MRKRMYSIPLTSRDRVEVTEFEFIHIRKTLNACGMDFLLDRSRCTPDLVYYDKLEAIENIKLKGGLL